MREGSGGECACSTAGDVVTDHSDHVMKTAMDVAARLSTGSERVGPEVLRVDSETAALIIEIAGVDHVLAVSRVPIQRPRPPVN